MAYILAKGDRRYGQASFDSLHEAGLYLLEHVVAMAVSSTTTKASCVVHWSTDAFTATLTWADSGEVWEYGVVTDSILHSDGSLG